jgi:predicted amidohydrolase
MDTQPPRMAADLREALAIAMTVSSADPVAAYLGACAALLGVDTVFGADRLSTAQLLPAQTLLQPLQDQGRMALFGSVQHWIRPVNPWRTAREHREAVMPHVNIYPPRPSDQLDALGMVWDRGENPETRPVRRWDLPPMERSASFRIALCPMFCGAHPRFTVNPDGNRFTIDPTSAYSNPEALADYLTALAPQLESADVRLLVLPELSITEHARTQIAAMLVASRCMVGIVAGSFHIWRDGHAAPVNEAVFYVPDGIAWTHHKLGYFRVTDRNIRDLGKFFAQPLPLLETRVVEGIRRGSVLHFWDTRIGRIAVLICADAIARENMMSAIERCSPDLMLLPSLSMETGPFEQLGETLARRGISVFYVNAASACEISPKALAAFIHLGFPTPAAAPFSRIRWIRNDAPQASRFKGQDWEPAPWDQVEVLGNQEGIVIDLAAQLAWRPIPDP